MTTFAIRQSGGDSGGGAESGSYEAGLLTLPDATTRGVETIARLDLREEGPPKSELLGALRDALGQTGRLPLPARLAASTLRAGLGAIEEGIGAGDAVTVAIAFEDGSVVLAGMPEALVAVIRRDREVARNALARSRTENARDPRSSRSHPHPEVPARSVGLEGGLQGSQSLPEPSFEAPDAAPQDAVEGGTKASNGSSDGAPSAEALTSIFRYEKRHGRLRRVAESEGKG